MNSDTKNNDEHGFICLVAKIKSELNSLLMTQWEYSIFRIKVKELMNIKRMIFTKLRIIYR